MPRVARPEFARRVSTYLSDAEREALERIADQDGAPVAQVIRRFVRAGIAANTEAPRQATVAAS